MRSRQDFEREYPLFSHIRARAGDFDSLHRPRRTIGSIANFGCATGMETFALLQAFRATEATGIDVDADGILQATQTLDGLESAAVGIAHAVAYRQAPHEWWRDLTPDFVKGLVLDRIPEGLAHGVRKANVSFIQADITRPLCIVPDHFDLVYCDHVLYHVYCNLGKPGLERAIGEMARAAAPGACVVAVEPVSCSPERPEPLDFTEFFERCGLQRCGEQRDLTRQEGRVRTYCYRKPPA